jgi:hypothetical protein
VFQSSAKRDLIGKPGSGSREARIRRGVRAICQDPCTGGGRGEHIHGLRSDFSSLQRLSVVCLIGGCLGTGSVAATSLQWGRITGGGGARLREGVDAEARLGLS